jgi:hypothetical protein
MVPVVKWHLFIPVEFEYDFESDKPAAHGVTFGEADEIVIAQADDNAAWETPAFVRRDSEWSMSVPAELAARAAFFARLHRKPSVEDWLRQVIQERLDMEEAVFTTLKRDLISTRSG